MPRVVATPAGSAEVLADLRPGTTLTREELEERFLALCRSSDLPRPEVNAWIALAPTGAEADFMWRRQRLDIELDGRDVHMTPQAFERDRLRDQRLTVAGWRAVRFTGRQSRTTRDASPPRSEHCSTRDDRGVTGRRRRTC